MNQASGCSTIQAQSNLKHRVCDCSQFDLFGSGYGDNGRLTPLKCTKQNLDLQIVHKTAGAALGILSKKQP